MSLKSRQTEPKTLTQRQVGFQDQERMTREENGPRRRVGSLSGLGNVFHRSAPTAHRDGPVEARDPLGQ